MHLTDRMKLAGALNQHCGTEARRKAFMMWKWGVDSFTHLSDATVAELMKRYQPYYVERAWAVTDELRRDVYEFTVLPTKPIDNQAVIV